MSKGSQTNTQGLATDVSMDYTDRFVIRGKYGVATLNFGLIMDVALEVLLFISCTLAYYRVAEEPEEEQNALGKFMFWALPWIRGIKVFTIFAIVYEYFT